MRPDVVPVDARMAYEAREMLSPSYTTGWISFGQLNAIEASCGVWG